MKKAAFKRLINNTSKGKDLDEASLQAGQDGDYYETVRVNLTGKDEDDMVVLPDGTEIDVSEILDKLMHLDEF